MGGTNRLLAKIPKPAARWSRLFGLAILTGLAAGVAAELLELGITHGSRLLVGRIADLGGTSVFRFDLRILLWPMLGGLFSGVIVYLICPESFGHGTQAFIRAFHHRLGDLPLKGPLTKAGAAVGVISAGGSAGPEGPMAAFGAALGSTIAKLFRLTSRERRIILVAGGAAGIGAIFKCPLGGALFATSVLYREEVFEADAMVPSFVASVIGYSMVMSIQGFGSAKYLLPEASQLRFNAFAELIPYAVLGILCGLTSIFFISSLRFIEDFLVPRSRLPRWLTPAIGGLLTGGIACLLPQVMDGRYEFVRSAISGFENAPEFKPAHLAGFFAAVVLAKCIATAFTVGSGASGGALGPAVFIGGIVGAFAGSSLETIFPHVFPAEYRLNESLIAVGMGGVLAASMRTPLASIVMVTEMTGSYGLIVPSMVVCMISYVIGRGFGLNTEQVRSVAESPAHAGDTVLHMLETWRVDDVMERNWIETIRPEAPLAEMMQGIRPGTRPVFAVAKGGQLLGLISVTDIRRITKEPAVAQAIIAADMMTENLTTVYEDEDAYEALDVLRRSNHTVLPVVARDDRRRWVGMFTREGVFERIQQELGMMQETLVREHAGLAAIGNEGRIQQLVSSFAAAGKQRIQRLLVPMDVVGKSLRETDFRKEYSAQVIAIEMPDGSMQCPPDLDMPLASGHRLLAIMWEEQESNPRCET